jgi:hypothetical protein
MQKDSDSRPDGARRQRALVPLERATLKNIAPILEQQVDPSSHLVTDEFAVYYMLREMFASHHEIKHRDKQYVRKEADMVAGNKSSAQHNRRHCHLG